MCILYIHYIHVYRHDPVPVSDVVLVQCTPNDNGTPDEAPVSVPHDGPRSVVLEEGFYRHVDPTAGRETLSHRHCLVPWCLQHVQSVGNCNGRTQWGRSTNCHGYLRDIRAFYQKRAYREKRKWYLRGLNHITRSEYTQMFPIQLSLIAMAVCQK